MLWKVYFQRSNALFMLLTSVELLTGAPPAQISAQVVSALWVGKEDRSLCQEQWDTVLNRMHATAARLSQTLVVLHRYLQKEISQGQYCICWCILHGLWLYH